MDTKGIDLTQCINCRFRAVVDGKEVTGRIEKPKTNFLLTGDDWFGCAVTPAELDNLLRGAGLTVEDEGPYISGFEIVPRDPETYQDWQVGDVIWDTHESGDNGKEIFRNGEFVAAEIIGMRRCYTCQELFKDGYRLVLTDIEKRIIDEKKKAEWTPQDGDICYAKSISGCCDVFIFKAGWKRTTYYASCRYPHEEGTVMNDRDIDNLRSATDNEKLQLFVAMAKIGKRWNAEKKVVEDIPRSYKFRKGEPVLVRNGSFEKWCIAAYCQMEGTTNRVFVGEAEAFFVEVIPYNERTMHLLGTTEDYKEGE